MIKFTIIKQIMNAIDEANYEKVVDIAENYALESVNEREIEIKQMLIESGYPDLADCIIKTY
jgi:hypothetical protein